MSWLFEGFRDKETAVPDDEGGDELVTGTSVDPVFESVFRYLRPMIGVLERSTEKSNVLPTKQKIKWL